MSRDKTMKKDEICPNCGAEFKSKFMIRVDHKYEDPKAKSHYQSRSKRSVVGWMKFICNNYSFEEIQIFNLLTECPVHKEHWENKGTKKASEKPPEAMQHGRLYQNGSGEAQQLLRLDNHKHKRGD